MLVLHNYVNECPNSNISLLTSVLVTVLIILLLMNHFAALN